MSPDPVDQNATMRILVGTLHCGESQYDRCVEALKNQSLQSFEHFTISDLPDAEAHRRLYRRFMASAATFDLFLKLDADMVLSHPDVLQNIATYFRRHKSIDGISIPVDDFFTGRWIHGLNVYRASTRWRIDDGVVFTDQHAHDAARFRAGVRCLAPAAGHAHDPDDFAAYHYGLHRGVKFHACLDDPRRVDQAGYYMDALVATERHYRRSADPSLLLACLGGDDALSGRFGVDHLDNDNADVIDRVRELTGASPQWRERSHDESMRRGDYRWTRRRSIAWRWRMRQHRQNAAGFFKRHIAGGRIVWGRVASAIGGNRGNR